MRFRSGAIILAFTALWAGGAQADFFLGGTTGVFANPSPLGTVYSGVGTSTFTWGSPFGTAPNRLTFEAASFDVNPGVNFVFGHITYFNGTTFAGSTPDSVDLNLTSTLTNPATRVVASTIHLALLSTSNETGAPDPDADFVRILASPLPAVTFNGVVYQLELVGFANVGGAGSLIGSDTLRLGEERTATADLVGRLTAAVPEPGSLALLGIGVSALLASRFGRGITK